MVKRKLQVTAFGIAMLAATSLVAEPIASHRGPTCETSTFGIGSGTCPADVEDWCNDRLPDGCTVTTGYSCTEFPDPDGFSVYCPVAS